MQGRRRRRHFFLGIYARFRRGLSVVKAVAPSPPKPGPPAAHAAAGGGDAVVAGTGRSPAPPPPFLLVLFGFPRTHEEEGVGEASGE